MQNKNIIITLLAIIIIVLLGYVAFHKSENYVPPIDNDTYQPEEEEEDPEPTSPQESGENLSQLEMEYRALAEIYALKYSNFSTAEQAFKNGTDPHMDVDRIDFYVPGKFPREDGDPYFIGRGTIDESENRCVKGYMNLVTGVVEYHYDVCVIEG